jgi:hypothetical protein
MLSHLLDLQLYAVDGLGHAEWVGHCLSRAGTALTFLGDTGSQVGGNLAVCCSLVLLCCGVTGCCSSCETCSFLRWIVKGMPRG